MNRVVNIENCSIGLDYEPFIIAEMSANHNQSLDRALKIVEAAAECGVHALKLQTYTADTMTLDLKTDDYVIHDSESLWDGWSMYDLYQNAYTPWEWHEVIFKRCRELGVIPFSSVFDISAVDFLEKLNVPAYKIASPEITDIALIRAVSSTGKPVIISTGMADIQEIDDAVNAVQESGCNDLILLKCTTAYPANPEHSNLRTIPELMKRYDVPVGLSDHSLGIGVAIASIPYGASVIEKHFTLGRHDGGLDDSFSIEPPELKLLVEESKKAWQALGKVSFGPSVQEKASLKGRRSLHLVLDMKENECFTTDNLRMIRGGKAGLAGNCYEKILGKRINRDAEKGTALTWELVQDND